jgi:hypothetical protein
MTTTATMYDMPSGILLQRFPIGSRIDLDIPKVSREVTAASVRSSFGIIPFLLYVIHDLQCVGLEKNQNTQCSNKFRTTTSTHDRRGDGALLCDIEFVRWEYVYMNELS